MFVRSAIASIAVICGCGVSLAQQPNKLELKIDSANRTLAVSAEARVSVDPEVAILHIGFETKPSDAKSAYADGARSSNAIVSAIKQAGIPEASIHSESQRLEPVDAKNHKFKLTQDWTVKTPPERAGEILDVAITAGATDSGRIDWTVQDVHALEDEALDQAGSRARSDAAVLAKASGARLGALLYLTNQVNESAINALSYNNGAGGGGERFAAQVPPLAIEPRQVSREATVYAVFAIE
jgi:uncharacterized protein YggE